MAKRILIIDDDPHIVKLLQSRLQANKYETVVAVDGQDGLEKARKEKPDLILLDLMLPRLNGYKVCRMLKFDEKFKHIPIVIFTARSQDSDEKLGLEVGADAYLSKPFKAEILLEKINGLLKDKE